MSKPAELARELAYPITNVSVSLGLTALFLAFEFAAFGGVLGLFLAALVLPALVRYLMLILASRARGEDPGPLLVEHFLWFENIWSLFAIVHIALPIYSVYILGRVAGLAAVLAALTLLAVVIPASLAVLAITRSPLECLLPRTIAGLIRRCGPVYWVLPSYILAAALLNWWLGMSPLPDAAQDFIGFYMLFALFALTGGVVQPHRLHQEVAIHEPAEPDQETVDDDLLKQRVTILNHAYGFISRGNRAGGYGHIRDWLSSDPEPDAAWQWFFEQMLNWEIKEPALVYAQTYLSRLLHDGEYVAAVKLMMRCRLVDESFSPVPEDRELALEAAESCQNQDLARTLL